MKKKLLFAPLVAAIALMMTSCGSSKQLYTWYNYEDATYEYGKNPTDAKYKAMMEQYAKMEKQKKGRKVVPPGFNAEYGYLKLKEGKKDEALKYLNQEIDQYPESKLYIERIIKQAEK